MRLLVLSIATATAAVAACSGGDPPPDADEALACMTSGRGDVYAVGLAHQGKDGNFDVKLMSADPEPPRRNLNTWVIQVNWEATQAPVTGASMIVTPYMPDHQHGAGAYTVQVQETATAGQYQLSQINTWMPGYWEITISIDAGGAKDSVVYKFCIQA